MGRSARPRPKRLPEKLLAIRQRLGYLQSQMVKALGLEVDNSVVSGYELGTREPSLIVLLRYARLAGVSTDLLIDDELELPKRVQRKTISSIRHLR